MLCAALPWVTFMKLDIGDGQYLELESDGDGNWWSECDVIARLLELSPELEREIDDRFHRQSEQSRAESAAEYAIEARQAHADFMERCAWP